MSETPNSQPPPFEGLSAEERQKALDVGASMQFESATVDNGLKTPTITPTIGDDRPVYGETYIVALEPAPEATPEPVPSPAPTE